MWSWNGGTGGGFCQTPTIFIIKCLFLQNSFQSRHPSKYQEIFTQNPQKLLIHQKITRVDSQVSGLAQLTVLNFLVLFYEDPWEKLHEFLYLATLAFGDFATIA